MDRRAFIAALAGSGLAFVAAPVLAAAPRHEVINISTQVKLVDLNPDGTVSVKLTSNADEASARLLALKDTLRPGYTVSIAVDGEVIGALTA